MKNFKLITLIFIIVLGTFTTSCDNDDDAAAAVPVAIVNEFTYEGTSYNLSQGILEDYGDNGNGSYDFDISLFSDDFTIDLVNDEITGRGEAVYLDLNSDNMADLSDGTYVFDINRDAFVISVAGIFLDYDIQAQNGTAVQASSGEVILTKSGDEYTISFDLSTATGDAIIGQYKGTLSRA
ncbi:MAG: hypothetical protein ACI9WL_000947 [Rubritalea sp.]|jgi:hypothetical protein